MTVEESYCYNWDIFLLLALYLLGYFYAVI